jgi:membrane protein
MAFRDIWRVMKSAAVDFMEDGAMTLAAALSYYSALSLAPLMVLLITIAGFLGPETQQGVVDQVKAEVSPEAATAVQAVIENAETHQGAGIVSAILGIAVLLFGAATVFAQLQSSLNQIWEIEVVATGKKGLWIWIKTRLLSFGMILGIAFLLILSLAVSTALPIILGSLGLSLPFIDFGVTLVTHVVLFALIYKVLPDAHIRWSDVLVGASMTALLFAIGKFAISRYLAYSSVGSAYGTAGSMVVLLLWVYYSAVIFFFGAELTQAYARIFGRQIVPKSYAVRVDSPRAHTQRKAAAGA